jgi:glycosyltransferase involved in cell wall biosynthesis
MKVLHIAESIRGGIATQLIGLWTHQAAAYGPENVRLAVPAAHAGDLTGVDEASVRAFRAGPRRLAGTFRHGRTVAAMIRDEAPDIVHAHSAIAGAVVRTLKVLGACPAPVVYCPHGWAFDRASGAPARLLYRAIEAGLAPFTAAIICISKHDYRHARDSGIARRRLRLVYNGLPAPPRDATDTGRAERGAAADASPLRLAFAGRIDRQKGFDILTEALTQVRRPVHLTVVGDPVLDGHGHDAAPNAPHTVEHLGWLAPAEVAETLARSDVVIVPSRWEGFGLVAAEALRDGTPVIATRRGGLPEVVAHEVTGALVDDPDPHALATTIERLDRDRLARWRANTRPRFARHFTAEAMASRTMAVYADVVGRRGRDQDDGRGTSNGQTSKSQES